MESPCDQDVGDHKTTTEKSDAILMTAESYYIVKVLLKVLQNRSCGDLTECSRL